MFFKQGSDETRTSPHYAYDYDTVLAPLPMAATPIPVDLSIDWTLDAIGLALSVGENLLDVVVPNFFAFDIQIPIVLGGSSSSPSAPSAAPATPDAAPKGVDPAVFEKAVKLDQTMDRARTLIGRPRTAGAAPSDHTLGQLTFAAKEDSSAFSALLSLVEAIAELIGVYGAAHDMEQYAYQFRSLPLPWPSGVFQTDAVFAQFRVAGANPGILRRATRADLESFSPALNDATYARVTQQPGATIGEALDAAALYLVDYAVLTTLVPGTDKYVFAPKALFFVPAPGSGSRSLRPVAILMMPVGAATRSGVYFPDGGTEWETAKILVNMADTNYHELISHLGLTHLLTEPFVLATYNRLPSPHPLNLLLVAHFAGTLLINYAAQTTLVVDGGAVDKLMAGTIESERQMAATAVQAVKYNASFFPDTLRERGVEDTGALPDYPYRDDALSLWNEIHTWVHDYVSVFYATDRDVARDTEVQAWVQELVAAGHIQDIGDGPSSAPASISTRAYLVNLVTQIIFVASVQHAAVNFPQDTIMSFTPAMPGAAYAPFPALGQRPIDVLPPLQKSLLQVSVLAVLGGLHYTALGEYGGQFAALDLVKGLQVQSALLAFQKRLHVLESAINAKNQLGQRTPYSTLLPSAIPQSINI